MTNYNFFVTSQPAWGSEGRLRWVVLHSCLVLNHTQENIVNWKNLIKKTGTGGIHSILDFDSEGMDGGGVAYYFTRLMKGKGEGETGTPYEIIAAWKKALKEKVNNKKTAGAYIYDSTTLHDHLPGLGAVYTPGRQTITYCSFTCERGTAAEREVVSNFLPVTEGNYVLNTSLPKVPSDIMIYTPISGGVTKERVTALAKALHLTGNVEENDVNYYIRSDNFYFSVNKETGHVYFTDNSREAGANGVETPENLPSDVGAMKTAAAFLQSVDMTPVGYSRTGTFTDEVCTSFTDTGDPKLVRDSVGVFYERQIDGIDVMGSQFWVNVGSNGDIIRFFVNWRNYTPYKKVLLKSPKKAYDEFKTRTLSVHGTRIEGQAGKIIVNHVTFAYYTKPAVDPETYLEPVYRFDGVVPSGNSAEPFESVDIPASELALDELR